MEPPADVVPIDRVRALQAVQAAADRLVPVIRSIPDPNAPTTGLEWTLGQTAAHLVSNARLHRAWLRGEGAIDYGIPDLADRNLQNLTEVGQEEPGRMAESLREETAAYVREATEQPAGAMLPAENGPALSVELITAVLLGEILVHGFDLARSLDQPWPLGRDEANLVAAGALAILPQFVDPAAARGVHAAYELRMRGGPRVVVHIDDGQARVEPSRPGIRVDCRISADPAAFLLVGYGRASQWGPIARGKLLAWGRQPWKAFAFARYLRNP